jgi:hypothetical protein
LGRERKREAVPRALAFSGGYIAPEKEPASGKIMRSPEEARNLTTYHSVAINIGARDGVRTGDRFTAYGWGPHVGHPRTRKGLGWIKEIRGVLEVTAVEDGQSEARITESYQAIHRGDLVGPYREVLTPRDLSFYPVAQPVEGFIVAVKDREHQTVLHEVVYIDAGKSQGILPGDLFDVYRPARRNQPESVVGVLQVLATGGETATAYLVACETGDIHPGDHIRLRLRARGPE